MDTKEQIAADVLRTIPPVMRMVATELRQAEHAMMPTQISVLEALRQQPFNLSRLAELHAVSLPTMSSTVSKLVAQGWVARNRSQTDRRVVLLSLTPAGETVLDEIGRQILDRVTEMLRPLSPQELTDLQQGLAVLQRLFPPTDMK